MKSDEKLWEICFDIYREMYAKSDPPADFDKIIESGEGKEERFYMKYYLPQDKFEEIFNRKCKEHKLTKREINKVSFEINLGCSPTSRKQKTGE